MSSVHKDCKISKDFSDVETITFTIPDFKARIEKHGEHVESQIIEAHDSKWKVVGTYSVCLQRVFCHLYYCSPGSRQASVTFDRNVSRFLEFKGNGEGFLFCSHLEEDGSLVIPLDIHIRRPWFPKKVPPRDDWVQLYHDAASMESSDVTFSVEQTLYHAHTDILSQRCKGLCDFAEDYHETSDDHDGSPIPIPSVPQQIFQSILEFVYTSKLPHIEDEANARDLLVASDRLDCTHLKLYAESTIVERFLRPENTADMLVFADSHSCALLKESSMKLFLTHRKTVQTTEAWPRLQESNRLLTELLEFVTSSTETASTLERLDVTKLRTKLEKEGLELDGSREVLVERLLKKQN